jgi:hypothetical protein
MLNFVQEPGEQSDDSVGWKIRMLIDEIKSLAARSEMPIVTRLADVFQNSLLTVIA